MARLSFICCFLLITSSLFGSYPEPNGYVNDFANLLTDSQEADLEVKLKDFEKTTSNELSVVTVNSLDGKSVETYANELAKKWKIGKAEKNNGILLLVAPNERKVRIEIANGLTSILTPQQSKDIIDHKILPQFKSRRMDEGIIAGTNSILATFAESSDEQTTFHPVQKAKEKVKKVVDNVEDRIQTALNILTIGIISVVLSWVIGIIALISIIRTKKTVEKATENIATLNNTNKQLREDIKLKNDQLFESERKIKEYDEARLKAPELQEKVTKKLAELEARTDLTPKAKKALEKAKTEYLKISDKNYTVNSSMSDVLFWYMILNSINDNTTVAQRNEPSVVQTTNTKQTSRQSKSNYSSYSNYDSSSSDDSGSSGSWSSGFDFGGGGGFDGGGASGSW